MLSIIIPVLNDDAALQRCLLALKLARQIQLAEIIVIDGGESTACRAIVEQYGAAYAAAPRGRAVQMNAGARCARGEWLWFLHADCVPHADSIAAIGSLDAMAEWGCFRHRIDDPAAALRVIERMDNLRARLAALPYGDQGIFVRRDVFESEGSFREIPILEDVELARRLRRRSRPRVLSPLLRTDARRWRARGIFSTTLTNWRILWMYFSGEKDFDKIAALSHAGQTWSATGSRFE